MLTHQSRSKRIIRTIRHFLLVLHGCFSLFHFFFKQRLRVHVKAVGEFAYFSSRFDRSWWFFFFLSRVTLGEEFGESGFPEMVGAGISHGGREVSVGVRVNAWGWKS